MRFDRYVTPLVSLLASPDSTTPFTIGILGAWGSGKSSILAMLDEKLAARNAEAFVRVHFNPWVHRREANMIQPLLRALRDTLLADGRKQLKSAALQMTSIVGTLAADALLTTVSAGRVSIDKMDAAKERYVKARFDVDSELRQLRDILGQELAALDAEGIRAVFFIDDVDRCEPDQVIDLFDSIKLFLDVPGVFVVMAVSKDLVDRAIATRYQDFGFDKDGVIDLGDEYLEKMIQLPLYLLPLDRGTLKSYLADLAGEELMRDHGALLEEILVPNPRKIKRVLNFITVMSSMLTEVPGQKPLSKDLVLRLCVLRVQLPRLFAAVLANPTVLVALEMAYGAALAVREAPFKSKFGDEAGALLFETVKPFFGRNPQLAKIFTGSAFESEQQQLVDYLTLFGGNPA